MTLALYCLDIVTNADGGAKGESISAFTIAECGTARKLVTSQVLGAS